MVGTLKCRNVSASSVDLYNAFITKQRPILDSNSNVLKAHFMRENGISKGQAAYDKFSTVLANRHSRTPEDPEFCTTIESFSRLAAAASHDDLMVLAQSLVEAPVSSACSAARQPIVMSEAKAEPEVVPEAVLAAAPAPAPAPQPALAAKAAVIQQASAEADPKAPAPARDEALNAAIGALQAAVAALQAASSPGPVEAKPEQTVMAASPPSAQR
jgi:hypothetical protein